MGTPELFKDIRDADGNLIYQEVGLTIDGTATEDEVMAYIDAVKMGDEPFPYVGDPVPTTGIVAGCGPLIYNLILLKWFISVWLKIHP